MYVQGYARGVGKFDIKSLFTKVTSAAGGGSPTEALSPQLEDVKAALMEQMIHPVVNGTAVFAGAVAGLSAGFIAAWLATRAARAR